MRKEAIVIFGKHGCAHIGKYYFQQSFTRPVTKSVLSRSGLEIWFSFSLEQQSLLRLPPKK